MESTEYIKNVLKTESNNFSAIIKRFSDEEVIRGLHASMGLVTESAELLDVFKKFLMYGKHIDWVNIEEEAGDFFWYLGLLADIMGRENFDAILDKNIAKLKARYGDKFSSDAAITRNLEAERAILETV